MNVLIILLIVGAVLGTAYLAYRQARDEKRGKGS